MRSTMDSVVNKGIGEYISYKIFQFFDVKCRKSRGRGEESSGSEMNGQKKKSTVYWWKLDIMTKSRKQKIRNLANLWGIRRRTRIINATDQSTEIAHNPLFYFPFLVCYYLFLLFPLRLLNDHPKFVWVCVIRNPVIRNPCLNFVILFSVYIVLLIRILLMILCLKIENVIQIPVFN